jgi:TRAP-type C4-dicarboxylate transport system substrate-binding protein
MTVVVFITQKGDKTLKKLSIMLVVALVVILGGTLALTACSSGTTTTSTSAPSASTTASAPPSTSAGEINIVYSDHSPPTAAGSLLWEKEYVPKLKSMVPADIASRINFTFYHAEQLFPYAQQVNAVQQGLADITIWSNAFEVNRGPLTDVMDLPMMGWRSSGESTQIWEAMEATIPEFAAEWDPFVILGRWNGLKRVITSKEDATLPADFNGNKVIASGVIGDVFKSLGAAPIQQAPPDWFTSLDRGLADSLATGISMFPFYKLADATHYVDIFVTGDLGYVGSTWIMNKEKFNSLPTEVQNAMMKMRPWLTQKMIANDATETATGIKYAQDAGMVIRYLTPEQEAEWFKAAAPIHQQWIQTGESKGIPRQMVYDAAKNWISIYESGKVLK